MSESIALVYVIIVFVFGVVSGIAIHMQYEDRKREQRKPRKQKSIVLVVPPPSIYDPHPGDCNYSIYRRGFD